MSKELYEKNELVHITETGQRVVLASVDPNDQTTNDPMKRTIDQILPSDEDMASYSSKCQYYHHQYVNFMAANFKDIVEIADKKYPPEYPFALRIHDVVAVEKGTTMTADMIKE